MVVLTVGMPYLCNEPHLGGSQWILLGEYEVGLEETSLTGWGRRGRGGTEISYVIKNGNV